MNASITLISFEIFWWYLVYRLIRSRGFVTFKNSCPLLLPIELSPFIEFYRRKLVYTLWDILMILVRHIYISLRMVAPPCCPFELFPLNLLKSGKLVHSITLISFKMFWCYLVSIYIRSRRCVTFKNDCSLCCRLSCLPWITFEGKACVLNISYPLGYFNDIWYT